VKSLIRFIKSHPLRWSASILAFMFLAGCSQEVSGETTTYLLRSNDSDVPRAASQVLHALAKHLQSGAVLEAHLPLVGHVTMTPDASDPGVEKLSCTEGEPVEPNEAACLLLNLEGDFLRVQPVTWQSEAFYMYRIYVLPRSIFAGVDPAKDFVAIDVYLFQEPGLWKNVADAIHATSDELGARPFQP
jgi:hypothetical protein